MRYARKKTLAPSQQQAITAVHGFLSNPNTAHFLKKPEMIRHIAGNVASDYLRKMGMTEVSAVMDHLKVTHPDLHAAIVQDYPQHANVKKKLSRQLRERLRRYGRLFDQRRRYAAVPPVPTGPHSPTVRPLPAHPSKFMIRAARQVGQNQFALLHLAPARVEAAVNFRGGVTKRHEWVWAPAMEPRVVGRDEMVRLIRSGGVAKSHPPMYSPVPQDVVARLEGRDTGVTPQRAVAPAGKLRTPPSTRFKRRYARDYADESHQFLEHLKQTNDPLDLGVWSDWLEEHYHPVVAELLRRHIQQHAEGVPPYPAHHYHVSGFRSYPTFSPRGWSFYNTNYEGFQDDRSDKIHGVGLTHHSVGDDSTDTTIKETGQIPADRGNRRGWFVKLSGPEEVADYESRLRDEGVPKQDAFGRQAK